MTINGAITQLVMMAENSMMPNIFRPALDKVIETISELGSEPQWIPTSKECPPQYQEIWITSDLGDVELVYGKDGIWLFDGTYYTEPEIIAWMPANLPSPYKEEGEEE